MALSTRRQTRALQRANHGEITFIEGHPGFFRQLNWRRTNIRMV